MPPSARKSIAVNDDFPKSPSVARWKNATPVRVGRRKSYQFNDVRESPSDTLLALSHILAVKVQKETRSSLRHSIPATIPETSNLADQDDTEILPSPPLRQTNLDGQLESEEDDDVENETFANYQIPQAENRRQTGPKITTAQKEFSNQVEQARLLHGREEDLVRRVSMGIGFADRFEDLPADLGRRLTRNSFGSLREDVGVDSSIMMDESVMERTYGGGDESLDITGDFTAPRLSMGAEELLAGEEFDDSLEVTEQFSGDKRRDTVTQFDFMPEHDQVEDVAEDVEMENAEQTAEVFEKKKATPRKRNKVEGAYLPEGVIKKLVSRLGYKNLSKETLAALREASKQFLEQASEDLDAYAAHANRKTITADDMHQLLRRQRLSKDSLTTFALAQKHLPRELLSQISHKPGSS